MEELVQKIEELIKTINENTVSKEITIAGIIIPIAISIAVAIFAVIQHIQNVRLQRSISNRDYKVQMHADILSIYDGYCLVQSSLGKANENISTLLANHNVMFPWLNELQYSINAMCQSYNRANLLLPQSDDGLRKMLKSLLEKSRELMADILSYVNSGAADINRSQTWMKISTSYGIQPDNYLALYYNKSASIDFVKLYSNDDTKRIDVLMKEVMDLFIYENFDKYFEPYLRMDVEEGDK